MLGKDNLQATSTLSKDDLIVISGTGGFIAGTKRYFYFYSNCAYNVEMKKDPNL